MSQYPPLQVFNQADEPIGEATLSEIYNNGLLHRVVLVIVGEPKGKILLQRRGSNVATNANRWDVSAAGHVDAGEGYYEAAKRELYEELGIKNVELEELAYYHSNAVISGYTLNRFVKIYKTVVPAGTNLTVNHQEVAAIRWLKLDKIRELLARNPGEFSDNFEEILSKVQAKIK